MEDDFDDFQEASSVKPKTDEKYSKLKELINDPSLYKAKSIDVKTEEENKPSNDLDTDRLKPPELPALSGSRSEPVSLFSHFNQNQDMPGMFDDIPDEKTPTETVSYNKSGTVFDWSDIVPNKTGDLTKSNAWSQQELRSNTESESGWANFKTPDPAKSETNTPSEPKSSEKTQDKPKIKTSQPSSKYGLFQKNYEIAGLAPKPGMSAYDMLPPELDDSHDAHDVHDDFDKFGTFHPAVVDDIGVHHTISSLHGGFDDFGDTPPQKKHTPPSKSSRTSKENIDTYSVSSSEFSGWKSGQNNRQYTREDSQSVASLELTSGKRGSKEGTPSGPDNQSVSSLDMETSKKSWTPQDSRSVASLELKPPAGDTSSQEEHTDDGQADDENFGEFSSAAEGASDFSSPGLYLYTDLQNNDLFLLP